MVDPRDLGRFVAVNSELGVGRLSTLGENGEARVRFFRCPSPTPYEDRTYPAESLHRATLAAHTRAYVSDGRHWRIGRIDGAHFQHEGRYVIAFPNGEGSVLSEEAFDVRWSAPIENPFEVLSALGGDTPKVYEPRLALISEWHRQRAAARGTEGLLLGSVELHDHQLSIVRRVAEDPIQRYLLADEVGLGKTIEAGALVWQYLDRHPEARVLILAPDHLRQQWVEELVGKFRANHFPLAWLRVRAHDALETWPADPVDVLVVDEAHHFARAGAVARDSLDRLAILAHSAKEVLLLSATPVRSNEAAFLDLLHLLDPAHYQPNDLDSFVKRVQLRDRLALTYQSLLPGLSAFDITLYTEELTTQFPDDDQLAEFLKTAATCDDSSRAENIVRVREHLSESYRLHHRLLRTRRTPEIGASFPVRGRRRGSPFTLEIEDESDKSRHELLDGLRVYLATLIEEGRIPADSAMTAFRQVAERCGSLPQAVLAFLQLGLDEPVLDESTIDLTRHVAQRWAETHGAVWLRDIESVVPVVTDRLADLLIELTLVRKAGKVIVASSFVETATSAASAVANRWGPTRVALHLGSNSREENVASVARWLSDDYCTLLFCDASAEEGINLQAADLIIHLDLPWETFRLEQRIGRCDRYVGTFSGPIQSSVVIYGDQQYALNWFEFVADGSRVFDESVSSLQYVLADTESNIQHRLLAEGPDTLIDSLPAQSQALATEATRIAAHDSLDSVESGYDKANSDLIASDSDQTLGNAFVACLEAVGTRIRRPRPGVIELAKTPRPQVPFSVELAMAPWVGESLAIDRKQAVERALPILRAGHSLMDAVVSHLQRDDRGVAFAFLRPVRGHSPATAVFRTDYLIRPGDNANLREAASSLGLEAWIQQVIELEMPPITESVYMREDGVEVNHIALARPYDEATGDRNLTSRPELFARLTSHLDWGALCIGGLKKANRLVDSRPSVADYPKRAADDVRQAILRRDRQIGARRNAQLSEDGPIDLNDLYASVPQRLEHVLIVLGCGVMLLADPSEAT